MGGSSIPSGNGTSVHCLPSDDHSAGGLFITLCLFAGLICKIFLMDHIPVPYTVVVLVVGGTYYFYISTLSYAHILQLNSHTHIYINQEAWVLWRTEQRRKVGSGVVGTVNRHTRG